MRDADASRNDFSDRLRRFGKWLAARPIESWGFFAAGFLVARVLF